MRYLIMIMEDGPDPGLVPYTGVIHESKASALEESWRRPQKSEE